MSDATQPKAAQKLIGGLSPKMASLTDDLLFGDIGNAPDWLSVTAV